MGASDLSDTLANERDKYHGHPTRHKPARSQPSMANLQIEPDLPEIEPTRALTGWHREFCVELLGDGAARIFVRAVATASFKANELRRAVLFQRLDPRFTDLTGCAVAIRSDLERLADSARRIRPDSENLFRTVEYDRTAWERVQRGIDQWGRR